MEDQNTYNGNRYQDSARTGNRRYADDAQYAPQGGYGTADPRYAQYTEDPRYAQYTQDPRYAQRGSDPHYGRQGYESDIDPRYAQYTADPRYTQYGDARYASGQTGRVRVPREGYGTQGYAASGRTERIRVPREGYESQQGYAASGRTERVRVPRGEYDEQDRAYARGGETARMRAPRYCEEEEPIGEEIFEEDFIDEEYDYEDEERSAFSRRISAIRDALLEIPARTMLLVGGGIALVLVAIILLVVLLPGREPEGPATVAATETPELPATPTPTIVPTATPAPTPHPLETPLQFGMEADIVAEIQQRLIDLGYMDYPVVDGVEQVTTVYGRTTKGAIQTFQEKNGLDSDGWCGKGTYDLLMSDTCKAYFISRNDQDKVDDGTGPVAKAQKRLIELGYLKAEVTGYCGESTVLAVQKFQQKNGLDPDGKAGQQTLALLYSADAIDANGNKAGGAVGTTAATTDAAAQSTPAATTDDASTVTTSTASPAPAA